MECKEISHASIGPFDASIHRCYQSASDHTDVHTVCFNAALTSDLRPCHGTTDAGMMTSFAEISKRLILPREPEVSHLVLVAVPEGMYIPCRPSGEVVILNGSLRLKSTLDSMFHNGRAWIEGKRIVASEPAMQVILQELHERGLVCVCANDHHRMGAKPQCIVFSPALFFPSRLARPGTVVFNAHFFLMFLSDVATRFDRMGQPFGLLVLEGKVMQPPLCRRPALVYGNLSGVRDLAITDMGIVIDGTEYRHGHSCEVYVRPVHEHTPSSNDGIDVVVVGCKIVAYTRNGGVEVPASGFVIHLRGLAQVQGVDVEYRMPFECRFAIQCGPAVVRAGKPCRREDYPLYTGEGIPFPPTVYPQDWEQGRAARMAIALAGQRMMLIHVGGSKAEAYRAGTDSLGFSLSEMAEFARSIGCSDCVNLDGGGSAALWLDGENHIGCSDRDRTTFAPLERPVPSGLQFDFRE